MSQVRGGLLNILPAMVTACAVLAFSACGTIGSGGHTYNDPPFDDQIELEDLYAEAKTGSSSAMAHLGWRYDTGRGAPNNPIKASQWYRFAADEGHSLARNNLGCLFRDGRGVIQDYTKAAEWFRKAARQGNDHARNNLGWLHEHGLGVPRDYREAAKLYNFAAKDKRDAITGKSRPGHPFAQNNLGCLLRDCLLYTSPSPRDGLLSRMPSSA